MKKVLWAIALFIICCNPKNNVGSDANTQKTEGVISSSGMVVSAHQLASQVGIDIMEQGGNAFDAAVAVQFALAVVYPRAGNIGGGGFAVYRKSTGETGALDFREKAPENAHRDMYLDENGDPVKHLSLKGVLSVGVPGTVNGMVKLHERLGTLPFRTLLQPAIRLAKNGIALTKNQVTRLNRAREDFIAHNRSVPFVVKDSLWIELDTLKFPELATTLERIALEGNDGFYKGVTADLIIAEMQAQNGIISKKDLENYEAKWRKPLIGDYRSFKITTMPPPSSGGVALLQLLSGMTPYPIHSFGHNQAKTVHLMTELERRVYADRATYLGDSDYYPVPVDRLLAEDYMAQRMDNFNESKKTPSEEIKEGKVEVIESIETTHFSIVDKDRNAIAITTTLNGYFGSKVVVQGGGFFLNNEMDDFSKKAGIPNQFGLVGGKANAIAPGKRMLSSMTPTIVEHDGALFMVLGTPGGSTIITAVFQTIVNVIDHEMTMQEAVNAKKLHHQWLPDLVLHEPDAMDSSTLRQLEAMGHIFQQRRQIGKVDAVLVRMDNTLEGAADFTRGDDKAIGY